MVKYLNAYKVDANLHLEQINWKGTDPANAVNGDRTYGRSLLCLMFEWRKLPLSADRRKGRAFLTL